MNSKTVPGKIPAKKKRKAMTEANTETITLSVSGSALTALMRDAAERGDIISVFDMLDGDKITVQHIRDIIEGRSEIIGDSINGLDIQRTDISRPIDVQKRLDAFMKRQKRGAEHDGYEMACEGMARWARSEGYTFVADALESGDWADPNPEEDED